MNASTRRLIVAFLAWPAGFVAALTWAVLTSPSVPCPPGRPCVVELEPMPRGRGLTLLVLAFAPGLAATSLWWQGRGRGR